MARFRHSVNPYWCCNWWQHLSSKQRLKLKKINKEFSDKIDAIKENFFKELIKKWHK